MVLCTTALIASELLYVCFLSMCTNEVKRSGCIRFSACSARDAYWKNQSNFQAPQRFGMKLVITFIMPTRWSEIFNNSHKFSQKERSFQKQIFSLLCRIPQILNFPSYQLLMNDQKSYLQLP